MLMQNSNDDRANRDNKVDRVGKPRKKRPPDAASNLRKLKWALRDAFHKGIKLQRELASQSWPAALIPQCRLSNVRLRCPTDNDFGHLSILAAS